MADPAGLSVTANRRLVRVLAAPGAGDPSGGPAGRGELPQVGDLPGADRLPRRPGTGAGRDSDSGPDADLDRHRDSDSDLDADLDRHRDADCDLDADLDRHRDAGSDPDRHLVSGVLARLSPAGAFDPGRTGRRALAVVAAAVVLGAAGLAWWSRPQPEPVAPIAFTTTEAPTPTTPAELVVAVSGMVHEPGLVRLPPGSRVADALAAAGGPLPDADLDHLNLARKVVDGELITVGIPPPAGDPAGSPAGGPGGPAGGPVNLNTASQAELETLPGIGPGLAQRIIDYRTQQGSFQSVAELREVSGIGEVRFAELQDLVTV